MKKYKTCNGCRAAYTPNGDGDWYCGLEYKTDLANHKKGYTILIPIEPCPKPRTAKLRDELMRSRNKKRRRPNE